MIRSHGEAVDYQEAPPPSAALWGARSACSPGAQPQEATYGVPKSHLNEAQQNLLGDLEAAAAEGTEVEGVATKDWGGKGRPHRHTSQRAPTLTQQARWEAVQLAKEQGLSQRMIAQKLGMARDTVGKYVEAKSPPTKRLSAKERAKKEALAGSITAAD